MTEDELINYKTRLEEYMKSQRPYLNPDLNIDQLAENLEITSKKLSI